MANDHYQRISQIALAFNDWHAPWKFEEFVRHQLVTQEEQSVFNKIWQTALDFESWNYPELSDGIAKTMNVLTDKFNLERELAKQIARAASYQWK